MKYSSLTKLPTMSEIDFLPGLDIRSLLCYLFNPVTCVNSIILQHPNHPTTTCKSACTLISTARILRSRAFLHQRIRSFLFNRFGTEFSYQKRSTARYVDNYLGTMIISQLGQCGTPKCGTSKCATLSSRLVKVGFILIIVGFMELRSFVAL